MVAGFPITLQGACRTSPVICDLDFDGDTDIVYGAWDKLIHVWDMPFTYNASNAPWPTFKANQRRDGVYRGPELVDVPSQGTPVELVLLPPYPNPFNPSTSVKLYIPGAPNSQQPLAVGIYNLQGRRVRVLHQGPVTTGWHTWVWDGRDGAGRSQASGLYFLRAKLADQTVIQKMSLVK